MMYLKQISWFTTVWGQCWVLDFLWPASTHGFSLYILHKPYQIEELTYILGSYLILMSIHVTPWQIRFFPTIIIFLKNHDNLVPLALNKLLKKVGQTVVEYFLFFRVRMTVWYYPPWYGDKGPKSRLVSWSLTLPLGQRSAGQFSRLRPLCLVVSMDGLHQVFEMHNLLLLFYTTFNQQCFLYVYSYTIL